MKDRHLLLFFRPSGQKKGVDEDFIARLSEHGIEAMTLGVAQLHLVMSTVSITYANTIVLGLLAGEHAQNCAAARYMRTLYPAIGLLALGESDSEEKSISLIQSGVDNVCPASASTDYLIVVLLSLLRRYSFPELSKTMVAYGGANWVLRGQAWVLISPSGKPVALTTAERAFLLTLVHSPELRATHAALAKAVQADTNKNSFGIAPARLGVMVSRMRRKVLDEQGVELPLKSLHSWGYMFAGGISEEV